MHGLSLAIVAVLNSTIVFGLLYIIGRLVL